VSEAKQKEQVAFTRCVISVEAADGGNVIQAAFYDGEKQLDAVTKIVGGKHGTSLLAGRTRKALKAVCAGAFPAPILVATE